MSPPDIPNRTSSNLPNQTEIDLHFMAIALEERSQSDDPKAQIVAQSGVAAIIVKNGLELSRSANVLPPRLAAAMARTNQSIADKDRYFLIEHAERAALFKAWQAGVNTAGATMYCTRFPCSDCARAVAWAGIKRLVLPTGFAGEQHWIEAQRAALRILRQSGVTVRYLGPPTD